ncbi:uncharacterized protein LOC135495656 isoform X2 [Lineus longissimus]|uniref:uncharacterized protein LOC135495656 isoform X2 n=1 Tax=Lineus longissimus TaxID=88925 RepID=UPI00315D70EC
MINMAGILTILVFLSITTLVAAGEITCDYKETLSMGGAGSKTGDLARASSTKCLLELDITCQGCYMDIVFWEMELASTKPTQQSGTSSPGTSDNAIVVREQGKANVTILQGNQTGKYFITSAKKVQIDYTGTKRPSNLSSKGEISWKISYAVREIKHKSCYWGVNLRHTCPNNKCTDNPYECDRLTKYLDIPPPGMSKEDKKKIFMGIIGLLALMVIIFLFALCWYKHKKKVYLCLTCKECLCRSCNKIRKRHNSGTSGTNVKFTDAQCIIISAEDILDRDQDAQDTTVYPPTENQAGNSDGYLKLKDKDDEE